MEAKKALPLEEQIKQGSIDHLRLIFEGASKSNVRWLMRKVREEAVQRIPRIDAAFQPQKNEFNSLADKIEERLNAEDQQRLIHDTQEAKQLETFSPEAEEVQSGN